jgi:hypothetical protein
MYHTLLIHSVISGHTGCFHVLAAVNTVGINMGVQMSLQESTFNSFWHTSWSVAAGLYSNFIFKFLRSHHIAFHRGSTSLRCYSLPGSQRLHTFITTFYYLLLKNSSHSSGCGVATHFNFDLYFPNDRWCWTPFQNIVFKSSSSTK